MNPELERKNSIDLVAARAKLAGDGGKRFWQSLEELSDSKEYRNFLENEFPANAEKDSEGINRRDVLKLMAASAAMAGLGACTKLPTEKIVPYVHPPEEIVAGRPLFYASSMTHAGAATGVLVESHMGRPTKIEGNPEHPGSLGGTDVFIRRRSSICTTRTDPKPSYTKGASARGAISPLRWAMRERALPPRVQGCAF